MIFSVNEFKIKNIIFLPNFFQPLASKFGTTFRALNYKKIKPHKYEWIKNPHLQSYFLLIDKSVFNTSYFIEFINSVCKQQNKTEIIRLYEIGLSELLKQHDVNMGSFYPYDASCIVNPYLLYLNPNNKEALFIKHTLFKA